MDNVIEKCLHLGGLRPDVGSGFRCPVCEESLSIEDIEKWVRQAERARDDAYSKVEDDRFGEILRTERQSEVYRRRKVLYEVQSTPRIVTTRPEMMLISYSVCDGAYESRIFYKEPRPQWGLEHVSVEAELDEILELRSHVDPNVRLAGEKVAEFHELREQMAQRGEPLPQRRVFYADEF